MVIFRCIFFFYVILDLLWCNDFFSMRVSFIIIFVKRCVWVLLFGFGRFDVGENDIMFLGVF